MNPPLLRECQGYLVPTQPHIVPHGESPTGRHAHPDSGSQDAPPVVPHQHPDSVSQQRRQQGHFFIPPPSGHIPMSMRPFYLPPSGFTPLPSQQDDMALSTEPLSRVPSNSQEPPPPAQTPLNPQQQPPPIPYSQLMPWPNAPANRQQQPPPRPYSQLMPGSTAPSDPQQQLPPTPHGQFMPGPTSTPQGFSPNAASQSHGHPNRGPEGLAPPQPQVQPHPFVPQELAPGISSAPPPPPTALPPTSQGLYISSPTYGYPPGIGGQQETDEGRRSGGL